MNEYKIIGPVEDTEDYYYTYEDEMDQIAGKVESIAIFGAFNGIPSSPRRRRFRNFSIIKIFIVAVRKLQSYLHKRENLYEKKRVSR